MIVFVLETGLFGIILFTGRISRSAGFQFTGVGDDNSFDRVPPVFPVDQGQVIVVGPKREYVGDSLHHLPFFGSKPDEIVKRRN